MKTLRTLFSLCLMLPLVALAQYTGGQGRGDVMVAFDPPALIVNSITTTFNPTPLCADNTTNYLVQYSATGTYNPGNNWVLELSDAAGSFTSPTVIGLLASAGLSGDIVGNIPVSTPPGSGYRIRVVSSDPAVTGTDNGADLTINTPSTWYADVDGDGLGDPIDFVFACIPPDPSYVNNGDDDCPLAVAFIPNIDTETCACELGYYATINGNDVITACTICPPGSYCPDGIDQFACPAGYFSASFGQIVCNACSAGTFSAVTGSTVCQSCAAGYYNPTTAATECLACEAGTFSAVTGSISCQSCAAGSYNPTTAATSCLACPAGSYSDATGASACAPCAAGYANNATAATSCAACPPGSYSASSGQAACDLCPADTYNPLSAQTSCLACPNGETSGVGATECTPEQACTTDLDFVYQADGNDDLDWQIFEQGTNILVQSGGGALIGNGSEATCLPDGCFYLVITDGGGDGIVGGGYLLKINSSVRLIDNLYGTFGEGGFNSGANSAIDNNEGFCLPVGDDRLIVTSCDKRDWKITPCGGEFVVANANAAVSAQYNVNNANSGYQMWWYNPNGGYSFKRFQSHSTSNGLPASATRACHFMLNGWSGNQLVEGGFYNVKVRGRINGVYNAWGPACRLTVNSTEAQCPRTKLMDLPGNQYLSCGQSRSIGANQYVHAKPVSRLTNSCNTQRANRYQFRFRIPAEFVTIVKTAAVGSGNYFVNTMGLTCGKTYEVDVRVSFDGGATWCHSSDPYGDICLLTTTCSFGMTQEGGHANGAGQSELRGTKQEGLLLYPNPNAGNELFVNLTGIDASIETVSVDIYDAFGKRVAQRNIGVSDGFVNTVLDVIGLANGMYMVSVTAGTSTYNERLVIQK